MSDKIRKVCSECGGVNVLADAFAEWDEEKQEWVLQDVFDKNSFCTDCDGTVSIIDAPITNEETPE